MTETVESALALWGLEGATYTFVAGRENQVYRVVQGTHHAALRFKRPGYRTEAELTSELTWMAALETAGLHVPRPFPSLSGALLEWVGDLHVDLLQWCEGQPLTATPDQFHRLGKEIARLHAVCDAWTLPHDFIRPKWNADGLLGDKPLWGRFWDNPIIDTDTRMLLSAFRYKAAKDLAEVGDALDIGLIHADLVADNVLVTADRLTFIDFDDGGFGYRLFELATVLMKHHAAPDFDALAEALLAGYCSLRPAETRLLPLFLALRAVTYVGWIIPRRHEPGGAVRAARFAQSARDLCEAYLGR